MPHVPKVAVVDENTFAVIGLKNILQSILPMMEVDTFCSFKELEVNHPERYFHYFVSLSILLSNKSYFLENNRKTIVMTTSSSDDLRLMKFHCLCVNVPEKNLIKSLLSLEQGAHAHGKSMPIVASKRDTEKLLSDREIEVLTLIVKGFINKEIADKLNISLSTVITHRRNIMDKLDRRSVSSLTIYAVMNGYVDVNDI